PRTRSRSTNSFWGRTLFVPVPGLLSTPDKKIQVMNGKQLEISFDQPIPLRRVARHPRRMARAQWWFAQMRQVVDRAWDWESAPPARIQQVCVSLTHQQGSR